MEKIKVFLVYGYDTLMNRIEALLNETESVVLVGKTNTAEFAELLIRSKNPHIVMIDVSAEEQLGAALTKQIKNWFPEVKVMVFSKLDDFIHISAMVKSGVTGYLLKNVKSHELHKAIDKVMCGETYIQNAITAKVINGKEKHTDEVNILSPREVEIIRLIAKEYTSAAIGKMLFISEHTVETHRKNIWRKTGVKSIIGLLNFAYEHQLI